ncbi:MAG TPA: dihydroorotate dehydrogenase [Caldithrix abyssi]|uniref:Dihydroorotate dehydrogenase n=1 Tax=Caldithrix abyssi TaxID=187145 RepID=A0A7V5LIH7_CALAY|nr:dihydroorotate dehydrogenase [Caldisericaceae bacterium]HHE54431.1 dihydroorotate dehydrogenase [Caldithrix abyssi]
MNSVRFLNLELKNPTVLASGILGLTASSMWRVVEVGGAGAVTTKSFNKDWRSGHKNPSILPFRHGLLNAVGLSNPGIDEMVKEIGKFKQRASAPIFASIFGRTIDEFAEVTQRTVEAEPDLLEVNVSCPNVHSEFGQPFGDSLSDTAKVTEIVKKHAGSIPVSIKLGPHGPGIARLAKVCEENGADAITAINTVGPGMLIDIDVRKPILSNKTGGVSGPAILPIAVKSVYEVYRQVKIPIIGTGGVTQPEDAVQLILAGASLIGIGTAVYYQGIKVFEKIARGIEAYLQKYGFTSLDEIRGLAHE